MTERARFIVDAAQSDAAVGEVLNAGTGVEVSIAVLAERVAIDGTAVEHVVHHLPQSEVQRLLTKSVPQRVFQLVRRPDHPGLEQFVSICLLRVAVGVGYLYALLRS